MTAAVPSTSGSTCVAVLAASRRSAASAISSAWSASSPPSKRGRVVGGDVRRRAACPGSVELQLVELRSAGLGRRCALGSPTRRRPVSAEDRRCPSDERRRPGRRAAGDVGVLTNPRRYRASRSGLRRGPWVVSTRDEQLNARRDVGPSAPRRPHRRSDPTRRRLLDLVPADRPVTWLRRGDGLVGWGVAAEVRTARRRPASPTPTSGGARLTARADRPRRRRRARHRPGRPSAPSRSPTSPATRCSSCPEVIVGRRGDTAWLTTLARRPRPARPALEPGRRRRGARPTSASPTAPSTASSGCRSSPTRSPGSTRGDLEKVVLARDLVATADEPIDVRWPLRRLAESYPMCWTFHVDGMFGATPEMLVRRERGLVTSRVLAGTIRRTGDDERDLALAATLARSSKDLEEHEYAVRSVADALDAALLVDERARGAVRPAPAQRHAPGHRRRRRRPRRRDRLLAPARRGAAPLGRRRRHPDRGRHRR